MVPLALGTQHTASTLLPASFCGAFAFKPSFGFTDMSGSNVLAARLAHVGFFARSVGDLAFFASAFDPPLRESECLTAIPRLALAHGPGWHHAEADSVQRLAGLIESLPVQVHAVRWNIEFAAAPPLCVELLNVNLALRFKSQPQEMLCEPLRAAVASGLAITLARYEELNAEADRLAQVADSVLEKYDALLSLSAPGEATRLEEGPGSGALCMAWSLCGLPTVSLPLLTGRNGLPIGVQLIGRRGQDRHLLSVASWLTRVAMGKDLGSQNV
jgi:Asp-tRNA(Asn)/Glu-tRNA(Gln) amidotransferase A subunit family amidase